MMKRKMKYTKTFALTVALIISALIIPKVYAAIAVDTNQSCKLEINVQGNGLKELRQLPVDVNLYKVADIKVTGAYESVDTLSTLDFSDINSETTAQTWQEKAALAKAAVDEAQMAPTKNVKTSDGKVTVTDLSTGLYLVDAQQLLSYEYQYDFTPYLISLPNNYYYSTQDDTWVYDLTGANGVSLKPEKTDRYGDLVIEKLLDVYNATNGGATFVFQVEATKTDIDTNVPKVVYSDVVSMTFNAPGTDRIVIEDIPAGAEVTVTEVYSGAAYELTSEGVQNVRIIAEGEDGSPVQVNFSNTHNDKTNGGNGVVNSFIYDDTNASWTHSATEDSTP